MKAKRFLNETMILGEGPIWDDQAQRLYWVDITAGQLWQHDSRSGQTSHQDLGERVGMCAQVVGGGMLVALEHSIVVLREDGSRQVLQADIEPSLPDNRFNDGKCDARGRLLAGTMDTRGQRGKGSLYSLDMPAGGKLTRLVADVSISNGIGFSPDKRHLYYVDTPSGALWRFDYDIDTGSLSNRIPLIDYTAEEGNFDGLTVDAQGHLWIAHWGGSQVSRWDPKTGKKLGKVVLPAPLITSCCFGGPNLSTLYITSAWNQDEKLKAEHPLSGALFAVKTDTQGLPADRFVL